MALLSSWNQKTNMDLRPECQNLATVPVVLEPLTVWQYKLLLQGLNWEPLPWTLGPPEQSVNVFTFGGAKRSGSDRECKYFPIGMNAREPLWHQLTLLLLGL